jgi:hypothetical protein
MQVLYPRCCALDVHKLGIVWKCNRRIKPLMRRGYASMHDYRNYRSTRNLKYLLRRGGEAERRSNRATVVAACEVSAQLTRAAKDSVASGVTSAAH